MKPKRIVLRADEKIMAVVPAYVNGPGWGNSIVYIYIRDSGGKFRLEYLQPTEQTVEMLTLFKSGAAMCEALISAVPETRKKK
jgi:hypothetical protein